ncbi:pilus assembly FimT family protein [Carnimonas bestiolae]|uniref:pilus assembly FimT family protein n=1 Tax=Carnimonas bestiolae TaxID=3402172 RepID=UPI003EDBB43E
MPSHSQSGFSVVSIMAAMLVASILLSYSLPSAQRWLAERRAVADRQRFAALIEQARLVSMMTAMPQRLCPRGDSQRCGQQWSAGALLDTPSDRTLPISRFELSPGVQLSGPATELVFRPDSAANMLNATFDFSTRYGSHHRLILNRSGRPREESSLESATPSASTPAPSR